MDHRAWASGFILLALYQLAAAMGPARPAVVEPPALAKDETLILDEAGPWRRFLMTLPRAATVPGRITGLAFPEPQKNDEIGYDATWAVRSTMSIEDMLAGRTAPPPAGWAKPDFDDHGWTMTCPATPAAPPPARLEPALLCLRGSFLVNDPAKVRRVTLRAVFTGGMVVHLNGQEVWRQGMPDGPIKPDTAGLISGQDAAAKDRPVPGGDLPVDKLVKGLNVLAVELHSWDYSKATKSMAGIGGMTLTELRLIAEADAGAILPASHRPAGLTVWNRDITDVVSPFDVPPADASKGPRPVRMIGPRNGVFSGQIVVGSDRPIKGLMCKLGELSLATGGKLPAAAAGIRFGQMTSPAGAVAAKGYTVIRGTWFEKYSPLVNNPPAEVPLQQPTTQPGQEAPRRLQAAPGAVIPVWVTANVPKGQAPGVYAGTLSVSADGAAAIAVPVEVEVANWAAPDPKDFVSRMSIYQSPDSLAAFYHVPLWSDKHWALIEQSLALMAQTGNHSIILPLMSKEQMGNQESFVHWIRQPEGTFKYDLTLLNRYLDVAIKTHAPSRIAAVCLVVQGGAAQMAKSKLSGPATVTQLDGSNKSDLAVPDPTSPDFESFWRPVLGEVEAAIRKRGLADRIFLGMPGDVAPTPKAVAAFHNILPNAEWFAGCHTGAKAYRYDLTDKSKTVPAGHVEMAYTPMIPDPAKKLLYGWQRQPMVLGYNRYGFYPMELVGVRAGLAYRLLMEVDLAAGYRGVGRIGADFWEVSTSDSSGNVFGWGTLYGRYPASSVGQIGLTTGCPYLLAPGPDGPIASAQFENLREGIQAAEALIAVQQAMESKKLPDELDSRCRALVAERVSASRQYKLGMSGQDWQDRDRRLFALAGEVAAPAK